MHKYKEVISALSSNVSSTADYVPASLDKFREQMVSRAETTARLLRDGKVQYEKARAPMAHQQKISKKICVKIGHGGKNSYVPNSIHEGKKVLKFDDAAKAAEAIEDGIIPYILDGQLDDALQKLLDGYRRKFRKEPQKALPDHSSKEAA